MTKFLSRFSIPAMFLALTAMTAAGLHLPGDNQKQAYKHHYEGTLHYKAEAYRKANAAFGHAYRILPGNFYFAMSYGLSLARLGQESRSEEVLSTARSGLNPFAEEYPEKRGLAHFFAGMGLAYAGKYGRALTELKESLYWQAQAPEDPVLISQTYNGLGYLTVMDQGMNRSGHAGLPAHTHIHRRDLERALPFFEKALEAYSGNGAAQKNYSMLCDSLETPQRTFEPTTAGLQKDTLSRTFLDMHRRILRDLELASYEEVLFLVDVSGSMVMEKVTCKGATRFEVMKEMASKALGEFPRSMQLGLGTIGGDCGEEPASWEPVGSLQREELSKRLRFLIPDGTTPLLTMLVRAQELFSDTSTGKKTIFLISDGANTCREPGLQICEWAGQLARAGIAVNVLTFLSTTFNNTNAFAEYICLAENTGGHIIYMDNYRCNLEPFEFNLAETCSLELPLLEKSFCYGANIDNIWMYREGGRS